MSKLVDEQKIERIYTVPLNKAYEHIHTKRAKKAVTLLREFLGRHMKAQGEKVKISNALNASIFSRGMQKPPRKVKIRVIKEGVLVSAYLTDEKIVTEKKEEKPEAKKEAAQDAKVEPKKEETEKKVGEVKK